MKRSCTHAFALALCASAVLGQDDRAFLREQVFGQVEFRSLGPANFGGRIADIDVDPSDRATWYVATATGGIWKTENAGTTWRVAFDEEAVHSIGDIAIAPADPSLLWVGTGEANNQRSSYHGNGVYKSTNGGRRFTHVGLDGTEHIGRIAPHPSDPGTVYVAAAGALYTPNPHRGIYRTRDGGETWQLVLHVDDDVGFIDVCLDPSDPSVVLAASYERRRRAHHFDGSGPGSGIWRSEDGGDHWQRIGSGLPAGEIGRIGLAFAPSSPGTVYALVENANPQPPRERAPRGAPDDASGDRRGRGRAADPGAETGTAVAIGDDGDGPAQDRPQRRREIGGELYRSDDAGRTWRKVSERAVGGSPHYYYGQVRVSPTDDQHVLALGVQVHESRDGGKSWRTTYGRGLHSDHHALWLDPRDPRHALLGNDGGLGETWDGGAHWSYWNDLPIGQFYAIAVDLRVPYTVYGGTQDNGTWAMPSRSTTGSALDHEQAFKVAGGDGFHVAVDPDDQDTVYCESQFGALLRCDLKTGATTRIKPSAPRGSPPLRCNWMSPIVISPHASQTIYFGSQYLHRSRNRGDDWEVISPDLTTADADKIAGNVPHCTITTIAESPVAAGQLWVGTDDGKVWLSRNGGERWVDLTDRFEGLPGPLWVSRVEASPHDAQRAHVAFTGYREDLRDPFLFVTTDGGESFRSIRNDLPQASINVIREHPRNDRVLFAGTEVGIQVSVDAGAHWFALGKNLPTTPVHDLLVHPRESDLVVGTHGRGLWIADITAFEELNAEVLAKSFHAFPARDGSMTGRRFGSVRYPAAPGWSADRADTSAAFRYYLSRDSDDPVQVDVLDETGAVVFSRRGDSRAGLHEVSFSTRGGRGARPQRGAPPRRDRQVEAAETEEPEGEEGGQAEEQDPRQERQRVTRRPTRAGQYLVRFTHGETVVERVFRVHAAIGGGAGGSAGDQDEDAPRGAWH